MPWAAVAAPIAGAVVGSMLSGGGGPSSNATQLPGMGQMAQNYMGATQGYLPQAQQYMGAMDPAYANQAFNAMYNNPYAGGMQQAGAQAGQMAGQFAPLAQQAGQQAFGAGQQALGAGQQIMQTAFDPQQALFNRMQQQTLDQANVANSMYGLGGSPAGAGMANQALGNLDINWQDQQLQRQLAGQQALGAGINQFGTANQQGVGMGQAGMGLQLQTGSMPYQTAQDLARAQYGAIGAQQGAMQGGLAPYQQNISNIGSYLGQGIGAQQQQFGQQQQQYAQQQQNAANIGQLATSTMQAGIQAYNKPSTPSIGTGDMTTGY